MNETLVAADALDVPYARICVVLGLTLLVTLGLGLGLRRLLGLKPASGGRKASRLLSLAEALPLGQNRALYVVEAAGRRLVIAAAGDRISLLSDLGLTPLAASAAAPSASIATPDAAPAPASANAVTANAMSAHAAHASAAHAAVTATLPTSATPRTTAPESATETSSIAADFQKVLEATRRFDARRRGGAA